MPKQCFVLEHSGHALKVFDAQTEIELMLDFMRECLSRDLLMDEKAWAGRIMENDLSSFGENSSYLRSRTFRNRHIQVHVFLGTYATKPDKG